MPRPASSSAEPIAADYLDELATIFAVAIRRLNACRRLPTKISPELSDSTGQGLEFGATIGLTVHRG